MRVVAGEARGRRLQAPAGTDVRPTSDRVRQAVFNALGSLGAIDDARVLDLFAGTGALAIEALSRGARRAVLVDSHRAAVEVVRANLATTGLDDRAEVVRRDALTYLTEDRADPGSPPFDLVLLDPPYGFEEWDRLLDALGGAVSSDTVVVIESDREIPLPAGWRVERRKPYGSTFVVIARPPEPRRPPTTEPR
jgi:16S rRNA (guanine966-N2)-methyltransferase